MTRLFLLFTIFYSSFAIAQTKKATTKPTSAASKATAFKVAYIFEDYILDNYAEVKRLDDEIKKKQETFQNSFNQLAIDYQTKYLDYQNSMKNIDSLTTEMLNKKLKDVQESKEASEAFQREAEKQIQQMLGDGIQKVKDDIKVAAQKAAKQKGYGYVLLRNKKETLMTGKQVLYAGDGGRDNISDLVLQILGSPVAKK